MSSPRSTAIVVSGVAGMVSECHQRSLRAEMMRWFEPAPEHNFLGFNIQLT